MRPQPRGKHHLPASFTPTNTDQPIPYPMDYAAYMSRRPPSPPALPARDAPSAAAAHLSAPSAPLLAALSTLSSSARPGAARPRSPPPPPAAEYDALCRVVASFRPAYAALDRQHAVRLRLEHLLTQADARALRVLHLALGKCAARVDALEARAMRVDDARRGMRAVESAYFMGVRREDVRREPALEALQLGRESVVMTVEQIACTLEDQVGVLYLLAALAAKVASLRETLCAVHREDRPFAGRPDMRGGDDPVGGKATVSFGRRASRSAFGYAAEGGGKGDRHAGLAIGGRNNVLRSQRSLPRRTESRLIPLVVKRALSYNLSPPPVPVPMSTELQPQVDVDHVDDIDAQVDMEAEAAHAAGIGARDRQNSDVSWWGDSLSAAHVGRSEPRLAGGEGGGTRRPGWSRSELGTLKTEEEYDDETFPPASPMSHCTTISDGSPHTLRTGGARTDSTFDQSVLVDLDSLCTEASSVLSRSGGVDPSAKPARRGSVGRVGGELRRGRTLARLGFGRMRTPALIKKVWGEVNELYGVVLTHAPHLVEEKVVTRASMGAGILGAWNARKGMSAGLRANFQIGAVNEAGRKIDAVLTWQQKRIVRIRKDLMEYGRELRVADEVISEAYLLSTEGLRERKR